MQKDTQETPATESPEEALSRLLRESAEIDSMVDSIRVDQVASDKADLEAIKKLDQEIPTVVVPALSGRGRRNERRRMTFLVGIAGALLVGCVFAYIPMLNRSVPELRVPLTELSGEFEIVDALEVGSMLYATVAAWSWEKMDEAGRVAGVNKLAAAAADRGIRSVIITNESKVQLAVWGREDGVQLAKLDR